MADEDLSQFGPKAAREVPVRFYDLQTGREAGKLVGTENVVRSIRFSPDGRIVYTAAFDSTIRAWRFPVRPPTGDIPEETGEKYRESPGHRADPGLGSGTNLFKFSNIPTGLNLELLKESIPFSNFYA